MKYFSITRTTTLDDLKQQFRKGANSAHPDKGGSKDEFNELQREYSIAKKMIANGTTIKDKMTKEEIQQAALDLLKAIFNELLKR